MSGIWKYLPVEPTPKMLRAGKAAMAPGSTTRPDEWISASQKMRWRWLAMVEASPTEIEGDRIKALGAVVIAIPAEAALPDLVSRIARLWAELHEADSALALELARKLPTVEIKRT